MRKFIVCLPVLLAVLLPSCLKNSESFTPYIQFSYFLARPTLVGEKVIDADTLSYVDKVSYYLLDTIYAGDSVVFAAGFGSLGNELKSVRVSVDPATMTIHTRLNSEAANVLTTSADASGISFQVNAGYNYVSIPFGYCPKEAGTYNISFVVESDSDLSPASITVRQPVAARIPN